MMKILDALLESLQGVDVPVRDICTGAFWTLVTTRHTGLASTYREGDDHHAEHAELPVPRAGELLGQPARVLLEMARSTHTVAAAIGVATINSLLDVDEARCTEQNAFDLLAEKGRGRDIAVVGHFPFVSELRPLARNLWVIEKRARSGELPSEEAGKILPRCEVVCLTGTALINHTLDGLLELCRGAYVVLTGPSSPLSPILFDFGVSAVSGARVTDPETVKRFITQGATFRQLRRHGVRLLTLTRETGQKPI